MLLPKKSDPDSTWLEWVNTEYPYAPGMERWLRKRQPHQRATVGTPKELEDLRGIRDRATAVMLARLWENVNRQAAKQMRGDVPAVEAMAKIPPPPKYGYGNQPPLHEPHEPEQETLGDWAREA